ncbi:GNAT family N-acetyltransferase [Phaeodactylibacter xiamenensis]|uniref:GNAT family N-acetyltransferase n=1 Tax=Phaeodactylibacter xiamenensis TaxID=1524460 RepID=UPI003BAAAD2A
MNAPLMERYYNQRSARLTFRKTTEADIPAWSVFFIDNDRLHFLGMPLDGTPMELSAWWIHKQAERYRDTGFGHLAATLPSAGGLIGMAGVIPRDLDGETLYEVAYSLMPGYWGQGYGTEMAQQMKSWAFEHLPVEQVISIIHKDNLASQHVARKNGLLPWKETDYSGMPVVVYRGLR